MPRISATLQPRLRVVHRGEIALGPGKADLLEALAGTGSLAQAAREMEMSYMRAWSLVRTMNAAFKEPLVTLHRGGPSRGGATLTANGERVLQLYRKMQQRTVRTTAVEVAALEKLLRHR